MLLPHNSELTLELGHMLHQLGGSRCKKKTKGVIIYFDKNENKPTREDPARLLSSRPKSRGLHPAGALARPH